MKEPIDKVETITNVEEEILVNDEKIEIEEKIIEEPVKPENKIINYREIKKILVFLSEDNIFSSLFYDVFIKDIKKYEYLEEISFVYNIEEITKPLNNTLIIGPTNSNDLKLLPPKLGKNTFILALSNDYSLLEKFADNEILFIANGPYLHVEKLKPYIEKSETIGVLYKQNDYGLKVFNHFKNTYPLIYTKSSSFGTSAIDLELSVNLLGNLDVLDFVIIIDDTYSYKDLVGYLATDKRTYPLQNIFLIDNFLEQRSNLENYYKPIKRSNFNKIDISNMAEPHREYFFKQSIELSLIIANKIFQKKDLIEVINHDDLGNLMISGQRIDYPIIFD